MLDFKPSMMHFVYTTFEESYADYQLKGTLPHCASKRLFVEVSDEVHQFLLSMKRKEDAFARQVSRYHAYHSLDDPAFSAESYLLVPTPTPAEIIERQQHLVNINHTILALSPNKQSGATITSIVGFPCQA